MQGPSFALRELQRKERFCELPEGPPQPRIKNKVNDKYLDGLERLIDALSDHVRKIQDEELRATGRFAYELKQLQGQTHDKRAKKEDKARKEFESRIDRIRWKRKNYREMLYEAIRERKNLLDSMQISKDDEEIYRRKLAHLELQEPSQESKNRFSHAKTPVFSIMISILQVLLLFVFAFGTEYESDKNETKNIGDPAAIESFYSFFINISLLIFVGIGLLLAVLRKLAYSAMGFTLFIGAFSFQCTILALGFFKLLDEVNTNDAEWRKIPLTMELALEGLFGCAGSIVAISTVLGRISPLKLTFLSLFQVVFYCLNYWLGLLVLEVSDAGRSMFVWLFAAYFGLAASKFIGSKGALTSDTKVPNYNSDTFGMLGVIIIWVLFPSFNVAFVNQSSASYRVVINTVLALCSSSTFAFLTSRTFRGGKFAIGDIHGGIIAGGVAIGSSADMTVGPGGALAVGAIAASLCTLNMSFVTPWLEKKTGIIDHYNLHSIFAITGILSGVASFASAAVGASDGKVYGETAATFFPAGTDQAGIQILGLLITLGISIVSGLAAGLILNKIPSGYEIYFTDENEWTVPSDFEIHVETLLSRKLVKDASKQQNS